MVLMGQEMVTVNDILHAHGVIRPYIYYSPLRYSPFLSHKTGADVWLKLENWQPTGSFKIRGALFKIHQHRKQHPGLPVVTASAGNHGLGVAYAAQTWGNVEATIFLPSSAPQAKVAKLRRFPVTLHQEGETYEDAHRAAAAFSAQTGAVEVSAYDDPDVIAGQGTMGLEIFYERPFIDTLFVPVGGGGMLAGLTVTALSLQPGCRLIGVQPEASPAALLSYRDGRAYDPFDHEPTIADGLAGGFGLLPFALTQGRVAIELATETELRRAVYALLAEEQLVVEPSGAISIVPLLRAGSELQGKKVVCVVSGGNLDIPLLKSVLENPG